MHRDLACSPFFRLCPFMQESQSCEESTRTRVTKVFEVQAAVLPVRYLAGYCSCKHLESRFQIERSLCHMMLQYCGVKTCSRLLFKEFYCIIQVREVCRI